MEGLHRSSNQTTSVQHLYSANHPVCIWLLGSNQGRFGSSWCCGSLVPATYTGHNLWDHITNTEVWARTDQPAAISETIRHRRLAMLGHVSRMPSSADAYRAVYQHLPSDWHRWPGRPRQTWLATICRDLQQLDVDLDDVPDLAADRALWRGLTRGATYHSVACSWWWWLSSGEVPNDWCLANIFAFHKNLKKLRIYLKTIDLYLWPLLLVNYLNILFILAFLSF